MLTYEEVINHPWRYCKNCGDIMPHSADVRQFCDVCRTNKLWREYCAYTDSRPDQRDTMPTFKEWAQSRQEEVTA